MTMESQTREIGRLWARADVVPESINEEARTVEVVWTTGARVKRYSWFDGPWYEELSTDPAHVRMARLASGRAPVLLQHNSYNPNAHQGVVEKATIQPKEGRATLRFLKDDVDADKTWNKIRQRVLTSVSVGYDVHKMEKIEGGDETIPVYRAVDWEPYEISPVSMPADPDAHIRSEDGHRVRCQIITRGVEPQKESKMPEEQKRAADAGTPPPVVDVEKVRAEERQRAAEIHQLVERAKLGQDVARSLIEDGSSVDKARAVVLEKVMERSAEGGPSEAPSGARIEMGRTERDTARAQMTAWLVERAGFTEAVEKAKDKHVFARKFRGDAVADPGRARGLSMLDMARDFLESHKVDTRGMTKMEIAGRALSFQRGGPYQGTDSFPILFQDALNKILLANYALQSDTWRLFCGTDTVPDFRPAPRHRTGEMGGTLDRKNEHGEFKNKAIPDGARTDISTETRGNIIALTREAIINDDMGALANQAATFGRLAGRSIEVDVYALLALNSGLGPTMGDSNPFFHSSRGNVGTGSALGVAGLNADKVLMRRQKDLNGAEFIDLRPQTLLIAVELEADANIYNDAQYDPADNKFQKPNAVRGLFQKIVGSPRMSGTRRYLFADPAGGAVAIKVVFLEGQGEGPVMEMQEGWRVDGTEWKIRSDFRVQVFDPKGAVTNAGA